MTTFTIDTGSIRLLVAVPSVRDWKALFGISPPPDTGAHLGEDRYFCRLLLRYGHQLYIDHDASQHVGHVGDAVYEAKDHA